MLCEKLIRNLKIQLKESNPVVIYRRNTLKAIEKYKNHPSTNLSPS